MQIMYIVLLSVGILSYWNTFKARGAYAQKIKKRFFNIH